MNLDKFEPSGKVTAQKDKLLQQQPRGATLATRWSPHCFIIGWKYNYKQTDTVVLVGLFVFGSCMFQNSLWHWGISKPLGNMHTDLRPQENYPYYPQVTQIKMFLIKHSTTKHTMKCTVKHPRLVSQNSCPRWTDRQQWTEEQHQLIFPFMGDGEAQKVISRYIKQFRPTFTFGIYHHLHRFFGILVKSNTFTIKCHGVRDTPLYLVLNSRVLWFHFKFSLNTSEHQKQHAMTRKTLQ